MKYCWFFYRFWNICVWLLCEPKTVISETPWNTESSERSGSSDDFSGSQRPIFEHGVTSAKSTANFSTIKGNTVTYPTLGKGKSSSKCHFWGDMLIPRRVSKQCNHSEQITHRYHKSCIDPHKMGNWMTLDDNWYDLGTQDYHKGLKKMHSFFLKKGWYSPYQHKPSSLIDPLKTQPKT